ncbi:hypothetical protein JZ751_025601 [Albula glossodonta]|uniref:E3 ubiquitin-protein transferase MAEA n=1 Tax=Albula glossodonta TaxID=121402 RepID=A0A8T2NDV9_9TELE|nr:hypothetical protein JZ751_025601 [Albula glossodonta]
MGSSLQQPEFRPSSSRCVEFDNKTNAVEHCCCGSYPPGRSQSPRDDDCQIASASGSGGWQKGAGLTVPHPNKRPTPGCRCNLSRRNALGLMAESSCEEPALAEPVPYETLNKRFRAAQKNIDRETSHVTMVVAELEKTLSSFPVVDSVVSLLDGVVEKLSALKRKVSPQPWPAERVTTPGVAAESIQAEDESAKLCKRRIEHLKEHSSDQPAAASVWKRKRMDRMMVEHLLRCGYYNTAVKLARQSGIEMDVDGWWMATMSQQGRDVSKEVAESCFGPESWEESWSAPLGSLKV